MKKVKKATFLGNAGMVCIIIGLLSLVQNINNIAFMLFGIGTFLLVASNLILSELHKAASENDKKVN